MPPIDFIPMPSRSTSFSGATAATYDDADYDVLSVLSDCFSDSSVISSSNFGQLASGASATATGATSTGATATGNLSGSAEARVMNWVQHGFSSRISPDITQTTSVTKVEPKLGDWLLCWQDTAILESEH